VCCVLCLAGPPFAAALVDYPPPPLSHFSPRLPNSEEVGHEAQAGGVAGGSGAPMHPPLAPHHHARSSSMCVERAAK
jgi:hypothetical protein